MSAQCFKPGLCTNLSSARESLVETERQLKDLGQILKYAEQYKANHIYHVLVYSAPKDFALPRTKRSLSRGRNEINLCAFSPKSLKIAAASYSQAGSIAELENQISAKSTLAKTARESLFFP